MIDKNYIMAQKNSYPNNQYYTIGEEGVSLKRRRSLDIIEDVENDQILYEDLSISIFKVGTLRFELLNGIFLDIDDCKCRDKIIVDHTVYSSLEEVVPAGVSVLGKLSMLESEYIKYALSVESHYYVIEHLKVFYNFADKEGGLRDTINLTNILKVSKVLCQ